MRCYNCGNRDCFVLALECATHVRPITGFTDPMWALSVQCFACASTDVTGDPVDVLTRYLRR